MRNTNHGPIHHMGLSRLWGLLTTIPSEHRPLTYEDWHGLQDKPPLVLLVMWPRLEEFYMYPMDLATCPNFIPPHVSLRQGC